MLAALMIILFSAAPVWGLRFKIHTAEDGAFLAYLKSKGVGYYFGEDALATSPVALSVSDGVSSDKFPSGHLARYLTHSFTLSVTLCLVARSEGRDDPNCDPKIVSNTLLAMRTMMKRTIAKMSEVITAANSAAQDDKTPVLKKEDWRHSTTFATVFFAAQELNQPAPQQLNVFQKGDSLVLILRFDEQHKNWKPYMYTSEDQGLFNHPFTFMSLNNIANEVDDRFHAVDVRHNDVVIVASDGLFDNIPVSIVTFAFNLAVRRFNQLKQEELYQELKISPVLLLQELLEGYKKILDFVKSEKFNGKMPTGSSSREKVQTVNLKKKPPSSPDKSRFEQPFVYVQNRSKEKTPPAKVEEPNLKFRTMIKNSPAKNFLKSPAFKLNNKLTPQQKKEFHKFVKEQKEKQAAKHEDNPLAQLVANQQREILAADQGGNKLGNLITSQQKIKPSLQNLLNLSTYNPGDYQRIPPFIGNNAIVKQELNLVDDTPLDEPWLGGKPYLLKPGEDMLDISEDKPPKMEPQKSTASDLGLDFQKADVIVEYFSKTFVERCDFRMIFKHKTIYRLMRDWDPSIAPDLLDSCFSELLDEIFTLTAAEVESVQTDFDHVLAANAIAEMAKDMMKVPDLYPSPFWVNCHNAPKVKHPCPSFFVTKPDDITVVIGIVQDEKNVPEASKAHWAPISSFIDRLNFLAQTDTLQIQQDIAFKRKYPDLS